MWLLSPMDATSLLLGGVVFLCVWWWMSIRRPQGLPPGPGPALPLLGHLHLLAKDPRPQFCTWRRQYGDVFSLYLGGTLVVVLSSYSAIREALVNFADVFSDRPHDFISDIIFKGKGIVFSSGRAWKEQRKASLEILRAIGMGKNVLAEKIQEEITHYIQAIKDHQGAPVDLTQMTQVSISNNICSILFGKRYHYQDPEFTNYIRMMKRGFELAGGTALLNFMPALRYLPGDLFKGKELYAIVEAIFAFIDKHVAEHRHVLGKTAEEEEKLDNTDFIYSYLRQIRKQQAFGNVQSSLDDENLLKSLTNLFFAGMETTSSAVLWTLLFFLHHPHVQDKCFKEISDVIGPDRLPTMQDRPQLTYLEATICEVLRKGDIIPLSLMHSSNREVTFHGYVIPKDTSIITNLSSALGDPNIWGDPQNFRPERFISPDGKLMKKEELIPFGIGRRVCLGESLARMELFLYLATLIQHFHFLPPEDGQLPSLEGVFGMSHTPEPFNIRAVPRK